MRPRSFGPLPAPHGRRIPVRVEVPASVTDQGKETGGAEFNNAFTLEFIGEGGSAIQLPIVHVNLPGVVPDFFVPEPGIGNVSG